MLSFYVRKNLYSIFVLGNWDKKRKPRLKAGGSERRLERGESEGIGYVDVTGNGRGMEAENNKP